MSRRVSEFIVETDSGDLNIVVYEVRPRDVYTKLRQCAHKELSSAEYQELLDICCNLTTEQLINLYPSEMEVVIQHFKEVNASFLAPWPTLKALIEKVGLTEWIVKVVEQSGVKEIFAKALVKDWKELAATSLEKAT